MNAVGECEHGLGLVVDAQMVQDAEGDHSLILIVYKHAHKVEYVY